MKALLLSLLVEAEVSVVYNCKIRQFYYIFYIFFIYFLCCHLLIMNAIVDRTVLASDLLCNSG